MIPPIQLPSISNEKNRNPPYLCVYYLIFNNGMLDNINLFLRDYFSILYLKPLLDSVFITN